MATLSAEFKLWRIRGRAPWASQCQLGATFPTELHARWVLEVAFPTLHGIPRRIVEGGRLVESLSAEQTQTDRLNDDYLSPLEIPI